MSFCVVVETHNRQDPINSKMKYFIKSIDVKPLFIFTTAYSHYAVEEFNLNAVDYLVKPIPFHRFLEAVNRAQELFNLKCENEVVSEIVLAPSDFIFD
jgi:two-component system LytT family response regulator